MYVTDPESEAPRRSPAIADRPGRAAWPGSDLPTGATIR